MADTIEFADFRRIDIRVGTVVSAEPTPDAAGEVMLLAPDRPVPDGGRLY